MLDLVWLIPALPLAGFLLILLFGRRLGDPKAGYLATLMVGASFAVTVGVFLDLMSLSAEERAHQVHTLFSWVAVGSLHVDLAFLADPLSLTMCLFVTGIGTLIHLYAVGYMHGDSRFSKFFLYLNLFAFSMLMLVLGSNMLVTFLGWEGVGTCSYFLISFWHEKPSAATAGKKAFVTNRVGDWGFMMAMFFAFWATNPHTLSYLGINEAAAGGKFAASTATAIALFAFVGACGKSAQLPLYLWLPDAMEGPTPVSALIHAATMVTAGVYLMCRISPVLEVSKSYAPTVIAIVGALTALYAATVAVSQNDIKKVLAYSTVSQLGYMFLAVGSGAYVAAIFHMVTHAFFKALLFLGSGSVIHGMHHEQDMRRMGGLRLLMPITAGTFIVGWLAIAGVPPFAGFWSKDDILLSAFEKSPVLWVLGLATALLTAYYMTRLFVLTFQGTERFRESTHGHDPHESPWVMTLPLIVLSVLSVLGGAIDLPWIHQASLAGWLAPILPPESHAPATATAQWVLSFVDDAAALIGLLAAFTIWRGRSESTTYERNFLERVWRWDDAYDATIGRPLTRLSQVGESVIEPRVLDGAVGGVAHVVTRSAGGLRKVQSGFVRHYAAVTVCAVAVFVVYLIARAG